MGGWRFLVLVRRLIRCKSTFRSRLRLAVRSLEGVGLVGGRGGWWR